MRPQHFELTQNYPNPFNPVTTISFSLEKPGITSLAVYDLLGKKVAQLVNGHLSPGKHEITFDAHDLASGIYLYELRSEEQVAIWKMTLLQ